MSNSFKKILTPVGQLTLVASDKGLVAILWESEKPGRIKMPLHIQVTRHPILNETEKQLSEYFAGERTSFALPLDMRGTEFQKQVWQALQKIPFGQTRTYAELAKEVARPKAFRAVGAANGKNPISIVVPCHRVNGATGDLTGFAGGLEVKAKLLQWEASRVSS